MSALLRFGCFFIFSLPFFELTVPLKFDGQTRCVPRQKKKKKPAFTKVASLPSQIHKKKKKILNKQNANTKIEFKAIKIKPTNQKKKKNDDVSGFCLLEN